MNTASGDTDLVGASEGEQASKRASHFYGADSAAFSMTSPEITECPVMRTPRSHRRSSRLQGSQSLGGYCPDKLMPVKQQARRRGLGRGAKDNLQRKDSGKGSRQGAEQVLQCRQGPPGLLLACRPPTKSLTYCNTRNPPSAHPLPPAQQSFLPPREMPVSAQPAGK